MHIGYWWEIQKNRDHWEDQDVGGVDNIKMDLREIGWDGMDWIDLAQDSSESSNEPSGYIKRWKVLEWLHK
jgi:hypothetical protein